MKATPAIRVCLTHNPKLGLHGDEECVGEHLAPAAAESHCDKPGDGPNHQCCGDEFCGGCNNDGFLDRPTRKPTAAKPASVPTALSPSARKRAVAEKLILAAAQIAATWEHDEITADEARTMISSWMNYLPGGVWDERLGERSGAGRRAK